MSSGQLPVSVVLGLQRGYVVVVAAVCPGASQDGVLGSTQQDDEPTEGGQDQGEDAEEGKDGAAPYILGQGKQKGEGRGGRQ